MLDTFLTPEALRDFSVATGLVTLFVNAFLRLAPSTWRAWAKLFGLVAAFVVVFAGQGLPVDLPGWFTAIANGLTVFVTALGASTLGAQTAERATGARDVGFEAMTLDVRRFWVRW